MNGDKLQAKIYSGYAKAALRIGLDYYIYRPISAINPLANINKMGAFKAAFNAGDGNYKNPNLFGDAIWYGHFDGSQTQVGDYLVRKDLNQIYFIAGMQALLPIVCIECNRSITIVRQSQNAAVGAVGYGGMVQQKEVEILGTAGSSWPASILLGGKSQSGLQLPADTKQAGWRVLLPVTAPATIQYGDIVKDDLGRRFVIEAAEFTDLGWRLNTVELHT